MPNMDKTGPRGIGPMTGKGMGLCGGGQKRRFGRGFGYGRGYGFKFGRVMDLSVSEQKKILESELMELESEKQAIESKLSDLK
ncbi:MAG: DUF5320 family protein [Candidatus Woesearchaeota archaeon]